MNDEIRLWWQYAEDNKKSAEVLLAQSLFNPCIQNAQQAVEKYLKTVLLAKGLPLRRTHSIQELTKLLEEAGVAIPLSPEDVDLLDAIYLPSKYPLGSALPDFTADAAICSKCLGLVESVRKTIEEIFNLLKIGL
jgi:HEPN domain-containing protein